MGTPPPMLFRPRTTIAISVSVSAVAPKVAEVPAYMLVGQIAITVKPRCPLRGRLGCVEDGFR